MEQIKQDIAQIKEDIAQTKDDISDVKINLGTHIRRTDILEKEVLPISKFIYAVKLFSKIALTAGALYGIYINYLV